MRYEINGEVVTFYLENPKREAPKVRKVSFAGSALTVPQIVPMLDAHVRKCQGLALQTQTTEIERLVKPLLAWFKTSGSPWPTTSEEWSLAVLRFFHFYFTNTGFSAATTSSRIGNWTLRIQAFLIYLKEAEIIPLDVVIPSIKAKRVKSLAKDQPLLGQSMKRIAASDEPVQKLLVDIRFGMADADYLDSIEKQCRHQVAVIKDVCLTHWNSLMRDAEIGRQLAAEVSDEMIRQAKAEGRYGELIQYVVPRFTYYASPSHPLGVHWALAITRWSLASSSDIRCVTGPALRNTLFFPSKALKANTGIYNAFDSLTSMTPEQWQGLTYLGRLQRFAGLLSPVDAAAACCLLTIEHPRFTSESLQNAVLINVRGKPRLLMTDSNDRSIFCVDKPRAGSLKYAALSDLAQTIVLEIVQATAPARAVLKRAGDKGWRYLFLGVTQRNRLPGILTAIDVPAGCLTGRAAGVSLAQLYPVLAQNGLTKGTFDYRRLRNTMGVIRWFETGSIKEMSRTLGNSHKVALENYLPPALLHAWNTRIIRCFQNTLIVLAAHDEPYLLDVTDFSTIQDLQHFIAQLILDYPAKTSPLADEVQGRLGDALQGGSADAVSTPGVLNVRLSSKSLAYLYAFSDLARTTLSEAELDKVDILTGLAPRQFTQMAALLKHAAENKAIHSVLRDSLDVAALTECHGRALAMQIEIIERFAKLAVQREWADA